ncbi:Fic domain protein, MA2133 type [hydrothermal vent metagenome]|uniref:Fic domain protein, MA2133 type n=1 Tax=hydrothermal vent metagenome TaxID=652676 RepID=A0A3B0VFT7_9ZZZZ
MELNELLQQVDQLKAEIEGLRPIDAVQERRIMQKFRLDWTFHSNAIEGNQLTFGETKAFLLHGITAQGKPFRDYLDIKGHHEAIDYLLGIVRQQKSLTEADVRELHKVILVEPYEVDARTSDGRSTKRTIQPGQYKTVPNHVETSTGEMHFYATPEETPAKMADLMAWYRRELEKEKLHPLTLAGTFHYEFVRIHPFDDGNGRMARLLMNLIFMQMGFPPVIVRTEDKNNYLLALEQADTGDLEPFIVHIGNELLNALDLFLRGAKGEEIEEVGDFDKKITLLEKKIEANEAELKTKRISQKEQREKLLENFLAPFFSRLSYQLAKFDRFFETNFCLSSDGSFDVKFSDEYTEQLINHLSMLIGKLTPLEVRYYWEEFKTNKGFNLWLNIGISLSDEEFEIIFWVNSEEYHVVIRDAYGKSYSAEQIDKLVAIVANEIFKTIDQLTQ